MCDRDARATGAPADATALDRRPARVREDAFEDAYRASGTAVLGYALRRAASREDALDVVAGTFATAWRRRADLSADPDEIRLCVGQVRRRG